MGRDMYGVTCTAWLPCRACPRAPPHGMAPCCVTSVTVALFEVRCICAPGGEEVHHICDVVDVFAEHNQTKSHSGITVYRAQGQGVGWVL